MTPKSIGRRGPAGAGPLGASGAVSPLPAATLLAVLPAIVAGGCASAPAAGPSPGPEPPGEEAEPADDAPAALEGIRTAFREGRHREAALLADSLYFRLRHRPGHRVRAAEALRWEARALEAAGDIRQAAARLEEAIRLHPGGAGTESVRRLARLRIRLGDDPGAVAALAEAPGAADDSSLVLLRRAARAMSVEELVEALESAGRAGSAVRGVLLAELAVARARAGLESEARSAARRALEEGEEAPDMDRARAVLQGEIAPAGPARVGLLLPETGRFEVVGDRIREGIDLALERDRDGGRPPVELVVADIGSAPVEELLGRLSEAGVSAVVGPTRSEVLSRAADGRGDPGLLLVSPTATRAPRPSPPAVLTLWDREEREVRAARRAGAWLGEVLYGGPVGAVYPRGELGRRLLLAFRGRLADSGVWMVASSPYPHDATTLEDPISAVSAFRPRAVFAPGVSSGSVLQMVPQLSYYGIRSAVVLGGPHWAEPSALRRLEPSFSQLRAVVTVVERGEGTAWHSFETAYEMKYRKALGSNILPAMGHDAMLLVLRALEGTAPPRPRAVARRAAALGAVEGATGLLRPSADAGTVQRRTRVGRLEGGEVSPLTAADVRSWLEAASRLETARARSRRREALQAVERSGIQLEEPRPSGEQGGQP